MGVLPEWIIREQSGYGIELRKFLKEEIDKTQFEAYGASMGVYEERSTGRYMVRGRVVAGVISLEQLEVVRRLGERYSQGSIHLTTRQDIQFHQVELEETGNLIEELVAIGIGTKGAGGSGARNVVVSPLAGAEREEIFDITPYGLAIGNYFYESTDSFRLPRKYKVSLSNDSDDTANATFSDLGFVAKEYNGQRGFAVYGGGGLGRNPNPGICLEQWIRPEDVLYYVEAMKQLFVKKGNWTDRSRARIRYILKEEGEENFINLFKQELSQVRAEKDLKTPLIPKKASIDEKHEWVYVHTLGGHVSCTQLELLLQFARGVEDLPEVRISNTQGYYVRGLKHQEAVALRRILQIDDEDLLSQSVACVGAKTCRLGIGDTQSLMANIMRRFEQTPRDVRKQLPKLYISGCPNSCGQHQVGKIGLVGKKIQRDRPEATVYRLLIDGGYREGKPILGESVLELEAHEIPEFLYRVATDSLAQGISALTYIKNDIGG